MGNCLSCDKETKVLFDGLCVNFHSESNEFEKGYEKGYNKGIM